MGDDFFDSDLTGDNLLGSTGDNLPESTGDDSLHSSGDVFYTPLVMFFRLCWGNFPNSTRDILYFTGDDKTFQG